MFKIQANVSATRTIEADESHLETIRKFALFENLIDSNGIIDEQVLDKLKMNIRSILEGDCDGDKKSLLDLCLDVIYNKNMKAFGLGQLYILYNDWCKKQEEQPSEQLND